MNKLRQKMLEYFLKKRDFNSIASILLASQGISTMPAGLPPEYKSDYISHPTTMVNTGGTPQYVQRASEDYPIWSELPFKQSVLSELGNSLRNRILYNKGLLR